MGMDPEWAKLTGDFSSSLLLEGFTTVTVNGIRAYKNIETGEIIYDSDVLAASGIGSTANKANQVGRHTGQLIKVNKADEAADLLAERIGGESRVKFSGDGIVGSQTWDSLLPGGTSSSSSSSSSSSMPSEMLRKGSHGPLVKKLQQNLINLGYDLGSYGADEAFGNKTEQAVINFQRDHGLLVDGVVGSQTWGELLGTSSLADKSRRDRCAGTDYIDGQGGSKAERNNNIFTWQEADKYINARVFGIGVGHNIYSSNEISNLPSQITYKDDGYTYTYVLDEHYDYFMGIRMINPEFTIGEKKIDLRKYEYKLLYSDAPKVSTGVAFIGPLGGIEGTGKGLTGSNWKFELAKDIDLRGTRATYQDALDEAFKRTGLSKDQFEVTKWGKDINGKSIPVEWEGPNGASVNMDIPEWNNVKPNGTLGEGPHQPHIGYQTPGKGSNRIRGHIFIDNVPATR